MNLDIATRVRYPDGEEAGVIERVLIDADLGEAHEIVISTPGLIGRMVLVPVALLREDPGDVLVIDADREAVDALPDYHVESVAISDDWEMSNNYIPGGDLISIMPIMPEFEESNAPEGTIEISQGTEVICTDGRYGIVDEVVLAEEGAQVLGFVVRPDDEYSPDIEVPLDLVESADTFSVRLSCTIAELAQLATPLIDEQEEPEPESLY